MVETKRNGTHQVPHVCSFINCAFPENAQAYAKKCLHESENHLQYFVHNLCINKKLLIDHANFLRIYHVEKTRLLGP